MTDFTATQAGAANDGATFGNTSPGVAGTDYPDPAGGDNLDLAGFGVTVITGILGDDTATPPIGGSGTATLSGDLEIRPGNEGIAFNDLALVQGAHAISVAPTDNLASLCSFAGTGTNSWTGSGEIFLDESRGSTFCAGLATPDQFPAPTYALDIDWTGTKYYNFGSGNADEGMELHLYTGDSFVWNGGKYTECGQFRPDLAPQGFSNDPVFSVNNVSFGAWKGSFGASGSSDHPFRLQNFTAGRTVLPTMTNCFLFHSTPVDNYQIMPNFAGDGEIDMSGTTFLNFGLDAGNKDVNIDDCWFVLSTELDDVSIGVGRDGTSTQSFDGVSVTGVSENYHPLNISGSSSAVTYLINDLFIDGCGFTFASDTGEFLIFTQRITLNNPLLVHSAATLNPSLGTDGEIGVIRGTFHNVPAILGGEAAGNTTMFRDIKSCILSSPYEDGCIKDGGGSMLTQTVEDIDYNAFIEVEMAATNTVHTTLGDDGYFEDDSAGHLTYGVNDLHVTDFEFADDTRHGYVWANSLGYTNNEQGLEDAVCAGFGVTIAGADQTVNSSANHANYRAYLTVGYTSTNTTLQGAGDAGVDIGAFDIAAAAGAVSVLMHNANLGKNLLKGSNL